VIEYLTLPTVLAICEEAGFVVRDVGLLDAALARPQATVFGEDAYLDIESKAAALGESINRSHPLIDDNERLSWLLMVIFYDLNGFDLAADVDDAERIILRVAAGAGDFTELAGWFREHRSKITD
jgi:death on curing protein